LERMKRGQWKRCTELMTTSDLCSALVAGFELGDVQLRLVLPLLGRELREALAPCQLTSLFVSTWWPKRMEGS
jgi:hypothetical protein